MSRLSDIVAVAQRELDEEDRRGLPEAVKSCLRTQRSLGIF